MYKIALALCAIAISTAAAAQDTTQINFTQSSTQTFKKTTPNATPRLAANSMGTCNTPKGWCFVYSPAPGSPCRCCFPVDGCHQGVTRD